MGVSLLAQLEAISRGRPDRVLRLRGNLPSAGGVSGEQTEEAFELLVFRGFSCSVTHPTEFDPDQSCLPDGAVISEAELLQGPLDPAAERILAGPVDPEHFLDPVHW
ncbi:hypothetical protein KBZ18_07630 [Synechococcus sp. Cruz-9H2]|uniref:DUF7734 family protein n=1 Tax=unclassified Synechococcus TaxID=2626047 RepID=UPI0020CCBCF1|nr:MULTISPECIES: hypothetical protein [unclassified Synechococcus]MCP9819362.1 hypothetical protein [Synechococcus sp. Cruz-9H2]MCP9843155.1 hypothetical protein [Synechococcus sp. Edmonson 11F2]MCP9854900.1 hypothetical protein [Synechococcus sp. Cruz-9C9]MCP9862629.1 hypothetical protein [Synechococcus sp. Cruz-7E5]MCP9870272.1 hypothetical protein [Synechococcus sp. Cruz-7B9]